MRAAINLPTLRRSHAMGPLHHSALHGGPGVDGRTAWTRMAGGAQAVQPSSSREEAVALANTGRSPSALPRLRSRREGCCCYWVVGMTRTTEMEMDPRLQQPHLYSSQNTDRYSLSNPISDLSSVFGDCGCSALF